VTPAIATELGPWTVASVDAGHMVTLAGLLADPNPIHLDADVVKNLGMGDRTINQGPANMSYVINLLRREFPGGGLRVFDVRFLANVFAGDRVVAGGRVDDTEERDGETHVHCSVWLDVDGGRRALEGTAVVVLAAGDPSAP
jgi:3-hydroxybutyryl-CoA dehydratase